MFPDSSCDMFRVTHKPLIHEKLPDPPLGLAARPPINYSFQNIRNPRNLRGWELGVATNEFYEYIYWLDGDAWRLHQERYAR